MDRDLALRLSNEQERPQAPEHEPQAVPTIDPFGQVPSGLREIM